MVAYAQKHNIPLRYPHLYVSQLYGMGEALTYGLMEQGVRVAKLIPYGPYDKLLPYLYRRGIENSALSSQSRSEQRALAYEITRRKSEKRQAKK